MKRIAALFMVMTFSLGSAVNIFAQNSAEIVMTIGSPVMTVNGNEQNIDDSNTSPVIIDNRTLLPIRALIEAFGGAVDFNSNDKTVTLTYNNNVIQLQINSTTAYVNETEKELDTAPVILNGRTMLPVRFIADNFGLSTSWDADTKTVTVSDNITENDNTVVTTKQGKLQGTYDDGVYRYLGVPYATAEEKFVQASPVEPWEGIRTAYEYGNISPQAAILGIGESDAGEGTDNNCQNLNIWTPAINDGEKRPVMVWLHGGGFSTGSANEEGYDGTELSKYGDVVVVGVNHRLNVFGHLDLTAYGEKYKNSDNIGMTDIVMALQWIHDNIAQFGGDPDNVTLFGQSGGGAKVLAMMTTPEASGLFHKGIVQSGATENMGVNFLSKDISLELGALTVEKLGLTEDTIDEIQDISNEEIMDASAEAQQEIAEKYSIPVSVGEGYALEWEPVIDGDFLPENPVTEDGFAAAGRNIPLLIGSNLNEWTHIMSSTAHPDMTDEQKSLYEAAYPNEDPDAAEYVDTLIRLPMLKIMSHKADQDGAPVYAYVFTKQVGDMGSYHGAEIPYIFRNTDDDPELTDTMSLIWVNFARYGTPSAEGLPEWEPYNRETGATMILDDQSSLVYNHDKELIASMAPDYDY